MDMASLMPCVDGCIIYKAPADCNVGGRVLEFNLLVVLSHPTHHDVLSKWVCKAPFEPRDQKCRGFFLSVWYADSINSGIIFIENFGGGGVAFVTTRFA